MRLHDGFADPFFDENEIARIGGIFQQLVTDATFFLPRRRHQRAQNCLKLNARIRPRRYPCYDAYCLMTHEIPPGVGIIFIAYTYKSSGSSPSLFQYEMSLKPGRISNEQ